VQVRRSRTKLPAQSYCSTSAYVCVLHYQHSIRHRCVSIACAGNYLLGLTVLQPLSVTF